MSERIIKINSLIQQNLSQIMAREIEFPRDSLVTVTSIDTSPDMKNAKVFISVLPEKFRGTVLEILRKNTKILYTQIKKQTSTKFTPNLKFLIDESQVYSSEIDKILDEIK